MSQLAFIESGASEVSTYLSRLGWDIVDPATAPLDTLVERPDLVVGVIRTPDAAADLRRLATLHALAPEIPFLVVADDLDDAQGHHAYEVLVDVPIVRRGCEQQCLAAAIAAA